MSEERSDPKSTRETPRRQPLLLEVVQAASRLAVTMTGAVTALTSVMTGSEPLTIIARAGGAMLAVGLLLWSLNWLLVQGTLQARRLELEESAGAAERKSTTEWEA